MCPHDNMTKERRGNKRMTIDKTDDPLEANFKTSMLFTKSIKSLPTQNDF